MAEADQTHHVVSSAAATTMAYRAADRVALVPPDRPGVVIFLHGVNDPGANYDVIEGGLCDGLNERLSRKDLRPGLYGVDYKKSQKYKAGDPEFDQWNKIKYDPDTYLYQRTEVPDDQAAATHSMFIPFYWGYRAAPAEIQGGQQNPVTLRGQYQDKAGNRLSKHFAKGGGMFNNATTNIPAMYDPGWMANTANSLASLGMSDYQYSGQSPHRHYFVLAAERLAMLVREIRAIDPNETISIIGHSQGTVITLLAQALLVESSDRCADCVIMVDTPYSLGEPFAGDIAQPSAIPYTTRGKLNTLINVVKQVTKAPQHCVPPLTELQTTDPLHGGRTGTGWSPDQAHRLDKDGKNIVFAERDNRGKVYLYFCTEDTTVDLPNIQGIGTHGVPDTIVEKWQGSKKILGMPWKSEVSLDAMNELKKVRFQQRLWTKKPDPWDGKPRLVGALPAYLTVIDDERRFINGEPITPPYAPNLYGGEAIKGSPKKAGKDRPDDVSRDLVLGNPDAGLQWKPFPPDMPANLRGNTAGMMAWYNARSADPEDHTNAVRVADGRGLIYYREETPNEARQRMGIDKKSWDENSYHSAILRDSDNLRRVAAMDVAIGQAKALDDKDWRALLIAIADWKTDAEGLKKIQNNPKFQSLSKKAQALVEANARYYSAGAFPTASISKRPPSLVDAETYRDREKRQ